MRRRRDTLLLQAAETPQARYTETNGTPSRDPLEKRPREVVKALLTSSLEGGLRRVAVMYSRRLCRRRDCRWSGPPLKGCQGRLEPRLKHRRWGETKAAAAATIEVAAVPTLWTVATHVGTRATHMAEPQPQEGMEMDQSILAFLAED
ncbi:hypothetical protein MTO96_026053 [Rhipicephalus appendiculatus]